MIIKAYEYLFYKFYQWSIKVNGEEYYHKYSASLMVAVLLILNTITIMAIISILTGVMLFSVNTPKVIGVFIALGYGLFNYLYFSFNDKYIKILNRYENESEANKRKGNLIVIIYLISSLLLLAISGFFGVYINKVGQGV